MRLFIIILITCALSSAQNISKEIKSQELYDHIAYLASDSLKGRKPGTAVGKLAAEYIKKQISLPDVNLLADEGMQYFDIVSSLKLASGNSFAFDNFSGQVEEDFMPVSFSENSTFTAVVAFCGYGFDIQTEELTWQDYANIDVQDKWVLILRSDPEADVMNSVFAEYSGLRKKCLVAKDHGAAGVIFVSGTSFDKKDELLPLSLKESHVTIGMPVINIKRSVANALVDEQNVTIDSLEHYLNEKREPFSFNSFQTVTATININRVKKQTQNIVARLDGTSDEIVVIGAHYDHLGMGGPGSSSRRPDTLAIHNGADDNASGVAAIVEIFEKLALQEEKRKRDILFIGFGAEEMGALGSTHFIQNPVADLSKITFMFNFDMIGRFDSTRSLSLNGSGTATGLEELVRSYLPRNDIRPTFSPKGYGPSDQSAFYAENIPVLMFHTGAHDDYHTPNDDVEFINIKGVQQIANLAYDVIFDMAIRDRALAFQHAGPATPPSSRRRLKVTLGIMPDHTTADIKGLRVQAVMPERPAEFAGMKKGDIIVGINGKPVGDIYEYMHRLRECQACERITVKVMRDGESKVLIVEL